MLLISANVDKIRKLKLETRVSCPYGSYQYMPPCVDWAKENKKPLTLSRELLIWKIR
jgi:hypothetical protein